MSDHSSELDHPDVDHVTLAELVEQMRRLGALANGQRASLAELRGVRGRLFGHRSSLS